MYAYPASSDTGMPAPCNATVCQKPHPYRTFVAPTLDSQCTATRCAPTWCATSTVTSALHASRTPIAEQRVR
jgi:hypothetical protein